MLRVFTDPAVSTYESPGHPEGPWRVSRTAEHLSRAGYSMEKPFIRATEDDVLSVHSARHWLAVESGAYDDPDTPFFHSIADMAITSLSGALSAAASALEGNPAFSLMRPPGHHAGRERIAGFCYVNNMAVACRRALAKGQRVAVVDIDVHHGDGTQSLAQGQENWLVVSLHQAPLYPGTGLESEGNCLNIPLAAGTGESAYLSELEKALKHVEDFKPDLIGVSAGFDTYKECPLANLALEKGTYRKIGRAIAALGRPRFALLEGGYADDLPVLIENFLEGFSNGKGPA